MSLSAEVGVRLGSLDLDVAVDASPDEVVAVVGPNGAGKSTLLRALAGLVRLDRGRVRIAGLVVDDVAARVHVPPEDRPLAVVFQDPLLFPHLSATDNVAYGLRARGTRRTEARRRAATWLDAVGLDRNHHASRPARLSGGQAQRVALARALAPHPEVVVLDEPFSSLDVTLRGELRSEVRRILRAEAATALLVTHDQDEALAMGDQVAVMLDGRLAQVGPPEAVYGGPAGAAVATFLGDANLFTGQLRAGVLETVLGPVPLGGPDGPATGLVRPEDLDLDEVPDGAGRVVDVEYYGHDQLVSVALDGGQQVRARLHAHRRLAVGARVNPRVRSAYRLP